MDTHKPYYEASDDGRSFTLYRRDHTHSEDQVAGSDAKAWGQYPSIPELQMASRKLFGELATNAKNIS